MKKSFLLSLFAAAALVETTAQTVATETPLTLAEPVQQHAGKQQPKYGLVAYDELLKQMPEYADVMAQMKQLREKYAHEAAYNEQSFKRLFAEYLQGQKDFTQPILLKRQRDLQDAMEKGIAFRREADSLLLRAEQNMMVPLRQRLDQALRLVGQERGYELIVNTDAHALPFYHPSVAEDATPYVVLKLKQ